MSNIEVFQEEYPSLESYWRSIILFGRNVATYKFALAKSLLEIAPTGKTKIVLEDLAVPYSRHLCEHLNESPKQITSNSSEFLETCKGYNKGNINYDELISATIRLGFNNVIDAFHTVNRASVPIEFYKKDYGPGSKKIILTDNIFNLQELVNSNNFMNEVEARWNLVETAWELKMSKNLLTVDYDDESKLLFVNSDDLRRKNVTSAKDALNGYQKGKCFYCFNDISLDSNDDKLCDVDHFYPHILKQNLEQLNLDGVWNLVLSCNTCNRGIDGKFAKVPSIKYLNRLHKRNEFLIHSHHPLRETLMAQTGDTESNRVNFLGRIDKIAINTLIHRWETEPVGDAVF